MQSTDAISEEWIVIQNTLGLKPVSKNYSLFQIISLMLVTKYMLALYSFS